jgi:hypothetical protein
MAVKSKPTQIRVALPVTALRSAETMVLRYHAIIPTGHTREMIETPAYWCHVARKLKRHSRIEVVAEDFSFWGMLVVTASEEQWAQVWVVQWEVAETRAESTAPGTEDYKIDSIATGWRVIHKQTGRVIREGLGSRKDALDAIDEALKRAA